MIQTLLLFKGFMGTGKSTLSKVLGKHLNWPVVNIDDIADTFVTRQLSERQAACYDILFSLGESLLKQEFSVILESSLRGARGFERGKQLAQKQNAQLRIIDCFCSDETIWKERLESRAYRPTQFIRDWQSFLEYRAKAQADFDYPVDCPVLPVDTVQPLDLLTNKVVDWLATQNGVN